MKKYTVVYWGEMSPPISGLLQQFTVWVDARSENGASERVWNVETNKCHEIVSITENK